MASFVVTSETPSDDISSCDSSYDDGPAEDGSLGGERRTESRLYVLNRAGTGEVHYLLLTPDRSDIMSYRTHTDIWKPLVDVINFSVVTVDNLLYVLGGFHRSTASCLKRVLRYDASENYWVECAPMLVARAKCGVCAHDGKILVSGGEKSGGRITGSCEEYDIDNDTWIKAGMMVAARANHACAVYADEMYCAGGSNRHRCDNNLWLYEEHSWRELDPHYPQLLPCPLDRFSICTLDNTLYFIGGVTCKGNRNSPDKPTFCTQRRMFSFTTGISVLSENSKTNNLISPWNFRLPNMTHARHSHSVVTIGKKLFVIGGSDLETGQAVNACESFNTETGEWEEDFRFRKGDVSSVACVIVDVPRIPVNERKLASRLKWVMW